MAMPPTPVGKKLMEQYSTGIKKVYLELGGNAPSLAATSAIPIGEYIRDKIADI